MSAMESVLSEVLPSSSDELSMIWLRSTVKQLISDSDRKMHHQLMLISYLTNWISSCEQVYVGMNTCGDVYMCSLKVLEIGEPVITCIANQVCSLCTCSVIFFQ